MRKTIFDLSDSESRDRYKLLTGLVVPRPIGWIGTRREDGSNNLAPFSFFNLVSSSPPTVIFSAGHHPDRPKDSVELAQERGEFTVNIVSASLAEAMNLTSGRYGAGDDEFALAGLTAADGSQVDAPLVVEAPANLECRVTQIVEIGAESKTRIVFGEVVTIHIRDDALDGTRVDPGVIDAIGRMAGSTYIYSRDRFEIVRPG